MKLAAGRPAPKPPEAQAAAAAPPPLPSAEAGSVTAGAPKDKANTSRKTALLARANAKAAAPPPPLPLSDPQAASAAAGSGNYTTAAPVPPALAGKLAEKTGKAAQAPSVPTQTAEAAKQVRPAAQPPAKPPPAKPPAQAQPQLAAPPEQPPSVLHSPRSNEASDAVQPVRPPQPSPKPAVSVTADKKSDTAATGQSPEAAVKAQSQEKPALSGGDAKAAAVGPGKDEGKADGAVRPANDTGRSGVESKTADKGAKTGGISGPTTDQSPGDAVKADAALKPMPTTGGKKGAAAVPSTDPRETGVETTNTTGKPSATAKVVDSGVKVAPAASRGPAHPKDGAKIADNGKSPAQGLGESKGPPKGPIPDAAAKDLKAASNSAKDKTTAVSDGESSAGAKEHKPPPSLTTAAADGARPAAGETHASPKVAGAKAGQPTKDVRKPEIEEVAAVTNEKPAVVALSGLGSHLSGGAAIAPLGKAPNADPTKDDGNLTAVVSKTGGGAAGNKIVSVEVAEEKDQPNASIDRMASTERAKGKPTASGATVVADARMLPTNATTIQSQSSGENLGSHEVKKVADVRIPSQARGNKEALDAPAEKEDAKDDPTGPQTLRKARSASKSPSAGRIRKARPRTLQPGSPVSASVSNIRMKNSPKETVSKIPVLRDRTRLLPSVHSANRRGKSVNIQSTKPLAARPSVRRGDLYNYKNGATDYYRQFERKGGRESPRFMASTRTAKPPGRANKLDEAALANLKYQFQQKLVSERNKYNVLQLENRQLVARLRELEAELKKSHTSEARCKEESAAAFANAKTLVASDARRPTDLLAAQTLEADHKILQRVVKELGEERRQLLRDRERAKELEGRLKDLEASTSRETKRNHDLRRPPLPGRQRYDRGQVGTWETVSPGARRTGEKSTEMPVLRDERPPGGFKRPPVDARGPQRKKLQEIGRDKIGTRIVGESPEETPEGRSRTVDPEAGVFDQSCQIEAESDRLRGPASEQTPGYTAPPEEEDQPYWVDQGLRNAQEVLERGVGLARQREAKLVDRGYYGNQVPTASASQAGPEWEIAQFGMSAPVPTWPDPPAVMRQDGAGAPIGPGHTSTYLADKTHGHPSRAADSAVASMPPEPQPGAPPAHFRHERPSGGGPRTVPADGPRARPPQHGALARAGPTPQAQRRGPPQTRQQPPYLQVYDSEVRVPSYPQHPPPAQLPHHRGQQPQHPAQQQLPPGRQAQRPPYSEPQSQSPREGQVRPRAQLYQAEGPREKEMRDARIQLQYAAWFGKQGGDG